MERGILDEYELAKNQGLPVWMPVYFDFQKVQASNRTDVIEEAFEQGVINRGKLVESTTNHSKDQHVWAVVSREFYRRFGRDYFRDEYDVTAPDSAKYPLQWHMTTLTQQLVMHYNDDVVARFEWLDDGTARVYTETIE